MSKSAEAEQKRQRLAAKLRENLKRRKVQARARSTQGGANEQKAAPGAARPGQKSD